jgi:hypothetical protein
VSEYRSRMVVVASSLLGLDGVCSSSGGVFNNSANVQGVAGLVEGCEQCAAGGNMTAWLFFCRRDHRHGQAAWPGPHRGPAGRAEGPHTGALAPNPRPADTVPFCRSSSARPASRPVGPMAAARPFKAGLFGNNTNSRRCGASPDCLPGGISLRGEPSPQVLPARLGCSVRGSGRVAEPARRPRCGWRPRACPGRGSRAFSRCRG